LLTLAVVTLIKVNAFNEGVPLSTLVKEMRCGFFHVFHVNLAIDYADDIFKPHVTFIRRKADAVFSVGYLGDTIN
jgi:hypothetical protein